MPRTKKTKSSKKRPAPSKPPKDNKPQNPDSNSDNEKKKQEDIIPIDINSLPSKEVQKMLVQVILRLVSPLRSIPAQTNEGIVYIRPEEVAYITTTDKSHVSSLFDIHGNKWRINDPLAQLKKDLIQHDPRFFESHKSFIINLYAVRSLRFIVINNEVTNRQEVTFCKKVKGTALVSSSNVTAVKARLGL